jgi:hypothetical protein
MNNNSKYIKVSKYIKTLYQIITSLSKKNIPLQKIFARISILKKYLHVFKIIQSIKNVYQIINFSTKKILSQKKTFARKIDPEYMNAY